MDRRHAQVNVRGEPPIQTDFFTAGRFPQFQRAEVQKLKSHGLFEFVGESIRQKHPRDVCLDHLHLLRSFRVASGVLQEIEKLP